MTEMATLRRMLFLLAAAGFLALVLLARCWNWSQVFVAGKIFFVDADCYSRMTRVQQVLAEPWKAIRFHAFENAPLGTIPHTTASMDWAIAGLAGLLKSQLQRVDLAGAFISPLLGLLLAAFLLWWGRKFPLSVLAPFLLTIAVSPILVHGFLLGRPDHQSLILLLVGCAWAVELALWKNPRRGWQIASGILWALALWTSLFEPLILFPVTLAARAFVVGRRGFSERWSWAAFFLVLIPTFLFEGWRFQAGALPEGEVFFRWARSIGELHPATLSQLCAWTGWLLPILPFLLFYRFAKERDRTSLMLGLLVLALLGLSLWQMRWGYFLALGFAFALVWGLQAIPWRAARALVFLISLWPMAQEWDAKLFPDEARTQALKDARFDNYYLHEAAQAMISSQKTTIMAPWWQSPALAYWSRQNCVAGSSHEGLPGIVDSANFYLTTDAGKAREILQRRKVNYVLAYDAGRVSGNAAEILGAPKPSNPLATKLFERPSQVPDFLRVVYENQYFKIYEFTGL